MDESRRKAFLAFLNKSLSRNSLANIHHLQKRGVEHQRNETDFSPWLLNVQNGTLDLQTGVPERPNQRDDLLSKVIPVGI